MLRQFSGGKYFIVGSLSSAIVDPWFDNELIVEFNEHYRQNIF